MNQEKIGRFIAECRRNEKMTQKELAEKLGVTDKSVSKWERGICMPDISLFTDLCNILKITLNDLFAGEKIKEESFKQVADNNLLTALENSTFTLKDKIIFYKRKWLKEHVARIVLNIVFWILVVIILKMKYKLEGYIIGTIGGILAPLLYAINYNKMMIYVENRVYNKTEK